MKPKHLLLLGYIALAYAVHDFIKYGLHPDDRKK